MALRAADRTLLLLGIPRLPLRKSPQFDVIHHTAATNQETIDFQNPHSGLGFFQIGLKIANELVPLSILDIRPQTKMDSLSFPQ